MHIDKKGKDILALGEALAETIHLINLHNQIKGLYYVYIIMEAIPSYLLMLQKYINSKQKILK